MPLNETKPALTLHLPYLSAQSSLFIQTSLLYEWCGHALAVTAASPPICSKPIWPPVLPMSWPLSHLPWNAGQKLMGHASYHSLPQAFRHISEQPPGALCCHWLLSLSLDSITTTLLSTLADSLCLQPCIFWCVYIINVTMLSPA